MLGKNLIQAAAGNAGGEVVGVEDIFSTWLYTGNGSTQTITNGIDLAGEGGLVWIKSRANAYTHVLSDTENGGGKRLSTDSTAALSTTSASVDSFLSDGFGLATSTPSAPNTTGDSLASWTFRKAEKFFDVVTYTGDGVAGRTISHSLGSTPGFIVVKATSTTGAWYCLHTGGGTPRRGQLNSDAAFSTSNLQFYWGDGTNYVAPTASDFTVYSSNDVNGSGITYVAYLFAHDAGGFGDDGTESVIKCGSYTGNGSTTGPVVDLGWEPQWLLIKRTDSTRNWLLLDNMRGITTGGNDAELVPNSSGAEYTGGNFASVTATGFYPEGTAVNISGGTYIYIAIRRGPMKTPTDATKVFTSQSDNQTGNGYYAELGSPVDAWWYANGRNTTHNILARTRLTGGSWLSTSSTNAEITQAISFFDNNLGVKYGTIFTDTNLFSWVFRRAPGFFDVVAYTGNGASNTVSHNLGVIPEVLIIKSRSGVSAWEFEVRLPSNSFRLRLNQTDAQTGPVTAITSTNFSWPVGFGGFNENSTTYIAYLFATCPGVSKVGSYTGTGTTKDIDCGFTNGARFVLIKRTDSTGDWYVWDTARGIVSGNDPYLLLNSTAAEVTNTDYIDPLSSGFQISSTAPAAINANGGSFIFLAIA